MLRAISLLDQSCCRSHCFCSSSIRRSCSSSAIELSTDTFWQFQINRNHLIIIALTSPPFGPTIALYGLESLRMTNRFSEYGQCSHSRAHLGATARLQCALTIRIIINSAKRFGHTIDTVIAMNDKHFVSGFWSNVIAIATTSAAHRWRIDGH